MRIGDAGAAAAVLGGRPTRAEIDLAALGRNLRALARRAGRPVMAVVKADAYGHGAVEVARAARAAGAPWLGVATADEGLRLRQAGDTGPILVLGGLYPDEVEAAVAADLTPVVHALPADGPGAEATDPAACVLARLAAAGARRGRPVPIHVKVDTGMHRLGLAPSEVALFIDRLERYRPNVAVEGLMSHLAAADDPAEARFTAGQRAALDEALAQFLGRGHAPVHRHVDNSAGLADAWPGATMVRAGIALYGAHAPEPSLVEPVMSLLSAVTGLRDVAPGETVSYGRTFRATRPTRVAVVPTGYADGLPRQLSGVGAALVGGRRAPIAGRVCMDWTMLDVTDLPEVRIGDPVLWFGRQGDASLPAEEVAALAGTIAYTLFCGVGPRVPRRYLGRP
ncbi:MAG TPA: alanine racemase [Thermodesulfobacteriota bacterium]